MDAIRGVASGCSLLAYGYHSLANGCCMKTAIFYFLLYSCSTTDTCDFLFQESPWIWLSSSTKDTRLKEHNSLTAETQRLHDNAVPLGTVVGNPPLPLPLGTPSRVPGPSQLPPPLPDASRVREKLPRPMPGIGECRALRQRPKSGAIGRSCAR